MSPIQLVLDTIGVIFFITYYTWPLFLAAMIGFVLAKAYKSMNEKK